MNYRSAIILCGGKGTRLGELGRKFPKTLVKIQGQSILWYILNSLRKNKFNHFILPVGYRGNQIKKFIENIKNQGNDIGVKFKVYINKKQHQKGNTECGMYSLHTIISLLEKEHDVNFFLNYDIPDKKMEKLREVYFN